MSSDFQIELYQGPPWKLVETRPFFPIVHESLRRLYGWDLSRLSVKVTVVSVPHESALSDLPVVENLMPEFGFAYVTVSALGHVVYQHPHPLDDIVTRCLQEKLRETCPEVALWGFRLDLPGMPPLSASRPVPRVEGGFMVRPFAAGEKPKFQIRRVEEEAPPIRSLESFGVTAADEQRLAPIKVLLSQSLADELLAVRSLSEEVEEGGFLLGRVFREEGREEAFLVEITDAPVASHTGASLLHFTFTGDSFAEVKQSLRVREPGQRIVGWYHTHLFPATDSMGLSSIDLVLHFHTFRVSWQIAGLINLDFENRTRVLRFYVREGENMVQCPHWTVSASTPTTDALPAPNAEGSSS